MRSVFVLVGFLMLVVSMEFSVVDGRVLRSMSTTTGVMAGCEEEAGGAQPAGVAVDMFAVSADYNSSSLIPPVIMRSLGFRLASGPSKQGPGH
ncbi:hypothetical protein SLE2022_213610 [Rubroshorea leprosula]|uniref:Uncharacterized protein n=1 Tax=Rubroshorea leprosula TaxID=152421 RepID=A0AAV5IZ76_9ROSI|nr:hypothetical protein SLEP1_g16687 [Rubroshorea leprosula]